MQCENVFSSIVSGGRKRLPDAFETGRPEGKRRIDFTQYAPGCSCGEEISKRRIGRRGFNIDRYHRAFKGGIYL